MASLLAPSQDDGPRVFERRLTPKSPPRSLAPTPTALPLVPLSPLASLPAEMVWRIMRCLQPTGLSITTYDSMAHDPQRSSVALESQAALANVCRSTKWLLDIARTLLYQHVMLQDVRGLICFFRTLAARPAVRAHVRSFAWVGHLSTASDGVTEERPEEPLIGRGQEMERLIEDCCATTGWPSSREDGRIADILRLEGPGSFYPSNTLACVLALVPQLRSLFLLHLTSSPGVLLYALEAKAIQTLLSHLVRPQAPLGLRITNGEEASFGRPRLENLQPPNFLQNLSTLVIEPDDGQGTMWYDVFRSLAFVLPTCKALRRLELKGEVVFPQRFDNGMDWDPENLYLLPRPVGEGVRELVLMRWWQPHLNMAHIPDIFPKLKSFVAECEDGSLGYQLLPSDASGLELGDFQRELVRLRETLETLAIVSMPMGTWNDRDMDLPSLLDPGLAKMTKLRHLMTDCAWLFGRLDPVSSLSILTRLPRNLETLHLVDFWGISINGVLDEENQQELDELEDRDYYPSFPPDDHADGYAALEFFDMAMILLHEHVRTRFHHLRSVTLSSPCFHDVPGGFTQSPGMAVSETQDFLSKFTGLFRDVGVEFSIGSLVEWEHSFHSQWGKLS